VQDAGPDARIMHADVFCKIFAAGWIREMLSKHDAEAATELHVDNPAPQNTTGKLTRKQAAAARAKRRLLLPSMKLEMFKRVKAVHETSTRLAAPEQGLLKLCLSTCAHEKEARKRDWLNNGFTDEDFALFHPSKKPLKFLW
jgi:hypothetical protein